MTDDNVSFVSVRFHLWGKGLADFGSDSQRVEEIGRDANSTDALRIITLREIPVARSHRGDLIEYCVPVAPIDNICAGCWQFARICIRNLGILAPHNNQSIGVLICWCSEQSGVYNSKDRAVRANTYGQDY